jgi:hypothetical protein
MRAMSALLFPDELLAALDRAAERRIQAEAFRAAHPEYSREPATPVPATESKDVS